MKAREIFDRRVILSRNTFAELVVWEVPKPVSGNTHYYKYRLAFIYNGNSVIRYDNEAGKGDHKHIDKDEQSYIFEDVDKLINDFSEDIRRWQNEHGDT